MSMPSRRTSGAAAGPVAAVIIAVAGAATIAILNGLLAVSVGLLAIAGLASYLAARALVAGVSPVTPGRTAAAIGLGLVVVLGGALGSWALSLPQGGVLGPLDYVGQAMGPLLAILVGAGVLGAWAGGR